MPYSAHVDANGALTYSRIYDTGVLDLNWEVPGYILEADVTLKDAEAAGFMIMAGVFIRLEALDGNVVLIDDKATLLEKRRCRIQKGRQCNLKTIVRVEFIEVYVDDHLVLTGTWYSDKMTTGLFVEYGSAVFGNAMMHELDLTGHVTSAKSPK